MAEGQIPVPDPTVLTSVQILREIENLRGAIGIHLDCSDKSFANSIDHLQTLSWARIESILKILDRHQIQIDAIPHVTTDALQNLRALYDEKFHSIAIQFSERDTRAEQTSRDSKVAVDAALQAAKEAVGEQNKSSALAIAKSEAATTKQIDQQGTLISTGYSGLNDKIEDIKARLTLIEGKGTGSQLTWGFIVGIGGLLLALGTLVELALHH